MQVDTTIVADVTYGGGVAGGDSQLAARRSSASFHRSETDNMSERAIRGRRRFRLDDHRLPLPDQRITPAEMRELVTPPLPATSQIWRDNDGETDQQLVEGKPIEVGRGDVYYSVVAEGAHQRALWIIIDGHKVHVNFLSMTGTQLRHLVDPAVPNDRVLYRDIDGAPDERIEHDEVVTLRRGAEFFSVPHVTAGGCPH